ncbi:isopropylmalate isomerase small subunit [Listeria fleischmannii subsp. coloradonensis]|nr:isopropylmalate isomerase small subunit [Listeria fleischmannii subsp. coloradonensis]
MGRFEFSIDPTWKEKFLNGLDDIAITLEHLDAIMAYETKIESK